MTWSIVLRAQPPCSSLVRSWKLVHEDTDQAVAADDPITKYIYNDTVYALGGYLPLLHASDLKIESLP